MKIAVRKYFIGCSVWQKVDAAFQKTLVFIHLNLIFGIMLASEFGSFSTSTVNSLTHIYIELSGMVSFFKEHTSI